MIASLGQLRNAILRMRGNDTDNVDATILTDIDLRINAIQDWIGYNKRWEWRRRDFSLTTRPPYETGTITVTQGSRTITGTGTTWTKIVEMGYIIIKDKAYKIGTFNSTTSISLPVNAPYPEATESGITYKIIYPFAFLNPRISSLVGAKLNGTDLNVSIKDRLVLNNIALGSPTVLYMGNTQHKTFYETGTVQVTNASASVVGTGTSWTSDMEGMPFQVSEFGEVYLIDTVTDTTHLTLSRSYRGSTGSGKTYTIGKEGSQLVGFANVPDDYYFIELDALVSLPPLVDANDFSLIPNHAPLVHGVLYFAYSSAEKKNPVQIQQELANFKDAMKQLEDSYRVVSNSAWISETEIRTKQGGGLALFDPLNQLKDVF